MAEQLEIISILNQMLNKDNRQPKEYIGNKPFPKRRKDKVNVKVRLSIVRVGEIDTVQQQFQCEFYMRLRWEEPELKGKNVSSTSKVTWDSLWEPRFKFINAVKYDKHDIMKKVRPSKSDDEAPHVVFHFYISATFKEVFDLSKFPFDYQDLSLTLASACKSSEMTFIKDDEVNDNIREKDFFAPQEWKLCFHVMTETSTSEEMEGASQNKYPRYIIRMSVRRQYKFYIYNVLLIMCLITALAFSSFAVEAESYVSRIQISLILLLTSVAFKYNVQQYVPSVP